MFYMLTNETLKLGTIWRRALTLSRDAQFEKISCFTCLFYESYNDMVCVFYVSLIGMAYSLESEISIIFLIHSYIINVRLM